jgi:outer membrane protein assembly factor BamB
METRAANWGQWRGPAFNGSSSEADLPIKFSKTENVKWIAPLPGLSPATPVVWGDHVFVSSIDEGNDGLMAICLDRNSGKERWKKQIDVGPNKDERSNQTGPSPATDGQRVIFFYGTGDFACFDLAGKLHWQKSIADEYGDFAFQWTFSASPTMHAGRLYIPVLQRDVKVHGRGGKGNGKPIQSFILCFDPATGKEIFKHIRPSQAQAESKESYATLIPFTRQGRDELLLAGGDCLTGHDPITGQELWRWGTWNPRRIGHWRLVPSPVVGGEVILACAPKGDPVYAIGAGGKGTMSDEGLKWKSSDKKISSDVCTPAFYQGHFYVLHDKKQHLTKVDPKAGKAIWQVTLPGRTIFRASPTAADGKIYCMNHKGDVTVTDTATGELLHETPMGEEHADKVRSTIAVSQGNLYIRTNRHLYCVGK